MVIWRCIKCTFVNYKNQTVCYNCAKRRPKSKEPVQLNLWEKQ